VGGEVSACEQATALAPDSPEAWSRLAHALARTDRISDCLDACERALSLADDPEVRDLRATVLESAPRELAEHAAA
jgi:cytochrome c-type biogenesis protein CcmH/NrfG